MKRSYVLLLALTVFPVFQSCESDREFSLQSQTGASESDGAQATFTDITQQAGIEFVHHNDASPRRLLAETMGSGAAFFDYDGDTLPDLYLVNGSCLKNDSSHRPTGALYRNLGGSRFRDASLGSGLGQSFFGMGAAVGDVDNDGFTDLFVTGVGEQHLYRNRGDGSFQDITQRLGLEDTGFGASAAFLDYDRDGYLDLFVGRYVQWSPSTDVPCSPDGVHQTYCTPEIYPAVTSRLYRNLQGDRFEDVTESSGIGAVEGKALGVAILDHNQDMWPDIAVANDTVRNFLFLNQRDGTFTEIGVETGMAYSESGAARGGMGIDVGDLDRNGLTDVVIGNFSQEMTAYWRAVGKGYFVDDAAQSGIGMLTLMTLAFGTLAEDFDGDGLLDILIANGHIEPEISRIQPGQSYRQKPQLFWNTPEGRFIPALEPHGSPLETPLVGRGLASADVDGDGDLDVVITQNGSSPRLLRNDRSVRSWIRVRLNGTKSNHTGYGSRIRIQAGDSSWDQHLVSGRSYLSACEPVVTFGLGAVQELDLIEIFWPSGKHQLIRAPAPNQLLTIQEP